MKRHLRFIPLFLLIFVFSCKKIVEKKQHSIIIDAITNGIWLVEQYIEGSNNISSDFAGYEFKFNSDGTVTGTIAGTTSNGTWAGDANNYTITSNFPGASDPLLKLNAVWKITDSYWDYVVAEKTTPSGKDILHLRKKP